jgi:hypothetical protein
MAAPIAFWPVAVTVATRGCAGLAPALSVAEWDWRGRDRHSESLMEETGVFIGSPNLVVAVVRNQWKKSRRARRGCGQRSSMQKTDHDWGPAGHRDHHDASTKIPVGSVRSLLLEFSRHDCHNRTEPETKTRSESNRLSFAYRSLRVKS